MSASRPREDICTWLTQSTTRFLHNQLNALSSYFSSKSPPYENLPEVKGVTTADIVFSDVGEDSRKFAMLIQDMATAAAKHATKKSSIRFAMNRAVLVTEPDQLIEILVEHKNDLHPRETFPLFEHSFPHTVMAKEAGTTEWRNARNEIGDEVKRLTKNPETVLKTAINYVNTFMASKSATLDLKGYAESFTIDILLKGFIGADNVSKEFKTKVSALISEGVDTAVQLRNVLKLTLSRHMPVSSDKYLIAAEKLVKSEVIEKNHQSIFGDEKTRTDNWTTRKYAYEKKNAAEKNQQAWICKSNSYTIDNLVNDMCFLLTAGSETTTKLIMFTFLHVTQNPRVFSKLIDEIKAIGKKPEDWTSDDLYKKMPYIDAITLEALRLNPPLKYRRKKVDRPFTTKDGTQFKAGDFIFLHVGMTQRSEKTYDNPLEFRPERFEKENINQYLTQTLPDGHRHKFAWQPFGLGPRMCPGAPLAVLELKALLAIFSYYYDMVLQNKWHPDQTIETFGSRPDDTKEKFAVEMKMRR